MSAQAERLLVRLQEVRDALDLDARSHAHGNGEKDRDLRERTRGERKNARSTVATVALQEL